MSQGIYDYCIYPRKPNPYPNNRCWGAHKISAPFIPASKESWRTFGTRHSLINRKASHNATNPANALLYSETRLALMRAGFDTTAGIFHADSTKRDSFVTDVMEAVRSDVDLWLLEYLQEHAFAAKEFYEKKDGGDWLTLKLAPVLAETVSIWAKKVEPVVLNLSKFLIEEL